MHHSFTSLPLEDIFRWINIAESLWKPWLPYWQAPSTTWKPLRFSLRYTASPVRACSEVRRLILTESLEGERGCPVWTRFGSKTRQSRRTGSHWNCPAASRYCKKWLIHIQCFFFRFWAPNSGRIFGLTEANFGANSSDFHHLTQNFGNFKQNTRKYGLTRPKS